MRGKALTGATAVLILAFFFLPWFSVSFNGRGLGQFSGYQLAIGVGDYALDGLNGRSAFFFIPLSALVIFGWGVVANYRPSWQVFSAIGALAAAVLGLVVLVIQIFLGNENAALVFTAELGVWLTLFGFVFALVGAVLIFREVRQTDVDAVVQDAPVVADIPTIPYEAPQNLTPDSSSLSLYSDKLRKLGGETITPSVQVWLVVAEGDFAGAKFNMVPPMRIGRDPGNDVVIDDNSMSGYHAVVRAQGGVLHVQDLNSTNGIYLENQTNHRWQRVPAATLVNDMRIKLGRTVFRVEIDN